ncbi:MAG: HAD-IA family hydrolase [Acidobacteria bacterium]|nr:HAD-IA family hydrolase [Acidobacteriota bacterium]
MGLICFDLDGTLVDPLLGIQRCVDRLCLELGVPPPPRETVAGWIGFGIREGLAGLPGMAEPAALARALDRFDTLYRAQGLYEHEVYEGVHLLLARLKRQGHRLYIVSAKPTAYARRLTFQFDLNLIFDDIFGSDLRDRWQPKTQVFRRLIEQGTLEPGGFMIGDRGDDMRAARDHGLRAVGVTYGYGTREELLGAGAEVLLDSIPALDAWLARELPDREFYDPFSRAE